uniref:Uncharacterized protein n=1 Tax=Arundo donax TaxID=35708 RepID=A0A0A9FAZ6_ARUDO
MCKAVFPFLSRTLRIETSAISNSSTTSVFLPFTAM